ncbi:DNA cross-link repair protein SNM1 isoform X2 [Aristolochia californica]|uniref:DNA cross-link repair protein SNM1 isoform X2 n=1 Tax=Aristolochia californica TaxID=171875 RepID=UPI0035DD352E
MEFLAEEEPSISEKLDENGFPFLPLSDEDEEVEANLSISSSSESFASDFYRSGTDWSRLTEKSGKNFVQKDLFQMWGLKTDWSRLKEKSGNDLVQKDLFQMWGLKKPEELTTRASSKKRPNDGSQAESKVTKKGNVFGHNRQRVCPFYKKIPGTPFTVDAFSYGPVEGCKAYFLSHFHLDHYGGLSKGWSHGPIYCTHITARLVRMCLSVNPLFIHPLEIDTEYVIEGIKVTMLEANHCPGAALIHLLLGDGRCYLHTGDFRACKLMHSYPLLLNHHVNVLYLDTTYCNPKYTFPSKEDVLDFVVRITRNHLAMQPRTLIIVGAYSIGKEQVYLAISEALGVQIHANASRRRILVSFGWSELSGRLSSQGHLTPLHVVPISSLRFESLDQYLETYKDQFSAVLAFRPTGWTYSESVGSRLDLIKPRSKGKVTIYGVPYSEHSSFLELREFVKFLRPDKIIPTVNIGNAANRDEMHSFFREWLKTKDSELNSHSSNG